MVRGRPCFVAGAALPTRVNMTTRGRQARLGIRVVGQQISAPSPSRARRERTGIDEGVRASPPLSLSSVVLAIDLKHAVYESGSTVLAYLRVEWEEDMRYIVLPPCELARGRVDARLDDAVASLREGNAPRLSACCSPSRYDGLEHNPLTKWAPPSGDAADVCLYGAQTGLLIRIQGAERVGLFFVF